MDAAFEQTATTPVVDTASAPATKRFSRMTYPCWHKGLRIFAAMQKKKKKPEPIYSRFARGAMSAQVPGPDTLVMLMHFGSSEDGRPSRVLHWDAFDGRPPESYARANYRAWSKCRCTDEQKHDAKRLRRKLLAQVAQEREESIARGETQWREKRSTATTPKKPAPPAAQQPSPVTRELRALRQERAQFFSKSLEPALAAATKADCWVGELEDTIALGPPWSALRIKSERDRARDLNIETAQAFVKLLPLLDALTAQVVAAGGLALDQLDATDPLSGRVAELLSLRSYFERGEYRSAPARAA